MGGGETNVKRCFSCSITIREQDRYWEYLQDGVENKFQCAWCVIMGLYNEFAGKGLITMRLVLEAHHARSYYRDRGRGWILPPILTEEQYQPILAGLELLNRRAKEFERNRWFQGGLQKFVRSHKSASLGGEIGSVEVRCFTTAGRCLITLVDNDTPDKEELTLITDESALPWAGLAWGHEDMGPMGIQGLSCSVETGIKLIDRATTQWPKLVPTKFFVA